MEGDREEGKKGERKRSKYQVTRVGHLKRLCPASTRSCCACAWLPRPSATCRRGTGGCGGRLPSREEEGGGVTRRGKGNGRGRGRKVRRGSRSGKERGRSGRGRGRQDGVGVGEGEGEKVGVEEKREAVGKGDEEGVEERDRKSVV